VAGGPADVTPGARGRSHYHLLVFLESLPRAVGLRELPEAVHPAARPQQLHRCLWSAAVASAARGDEPCRRSNPARLSDRPAPHHRELRDVGGEGGGAATIMQFIDPMLSAATSGRKVAAASPAPRRS